MSEPTLADISLLDEIEIIPDVVTLRPQGVNIGFRVSVTGPTIVEGYLVAPDASTRELKFAGEPGDADWYVEQPFSYDEPIGVWRLRLRVGDLASEMEFEVRWDRPRHPIRVSDFDVQPRAIDEGESVTVTGRVEIQADGDHWRPFGGQPVLIAFRPDDDDQHYYLGKDVTDRTGAFKTEISPDESGWLRAELSSAAEAARRGEDRVALLRRADDQIHVQVTRALGGAVCSTPKVTKVNAQYVHRVRVRVNGVPATFGKVELFYGNSGGVGNYGTPSGAVGYPDGNGWFTAVSAYIPGHRWRAKFSGPPSDWSGWSAIKH